MNLKNLSDSQLLLQTKTLARKEREILIEILHHLREVDRRKLFSDLKLKSLFEYATKELGYSEDQAYRRINAMRLLQELPAIEQKIESGALTLANLSLASSALRAVAKLTNQKSSEQEKLKLLCALQHKTRAESETIALAVTGLQRAAIRPETRTVNDQIEYRILADQALQKKIEKAKDALVHKHPTISTTELMHVLCDSFLQAMEREKTAGRTIKKRRDISAPDISKDLLASNRAEKQKQSRNSHPEQVRRADSLPSSVERQNQIQEGRIRSRYIAADVRRFVWRRDNGECQKCGSQRAVEFDHILPFAWGGASNDTNLRLLCRCCNQRQAIRSFGVAKMRPASEQKQ